MVQLRVKTPTPAVSLSKDPENLDRSASSFTTWHGVSTGFPVTGTGNGVPFQPPRARASKSSASEELRKCPRQLILKDETSQVLYELKGFINGYRVFNG